jgi:hypothetical protein
MLLRSLQISKTRIREFYNNINTIEDSAAAIIRNPTTITKIHGGIVDRIIEHMFIFLY